MLFKQNKPQKINKKQIDNTIKKVNFKIKMTKCIAKTLPAEEQNKNPLINSANVSQDNITVTLNSIRRDSKSDSNCFLFKIAVDGKDAGEFTISKI